MNETTAAERVHIGFFGLRNAGKSSLVNAVTGQQLSVVSDVKGTTTDPVRKAMELLPLGPVMIVDTPGIDDEGDLGALRVQKTREELRRMHVAVLVTEDAARLSDAENALLSLITERHLPYVIVQNKIDRLSEKPAPAEHTVYVSAVTGEGVDELKNTLASLAAPKTPPRRLVGDLVKAGDTVVLVTPIDAAAPKGRLILPQQQTLRDLLDADASVLVTKDTTLESALRSLNAPPALVITDSQVFGNVSSLVPADIPLTSFSILFARYKGQLEQAVKGAAMLDRLQDGDRVLISEGCTHHRQCGDIGTEKMPRWLTSYTGKRLQFAFTSGGTFPDDLSGTALVVHCGGCMLNEQEMSYRAHHAANAAVPMTNYGIAIAHMNGILRRSVAPFPSVAALL